MTAKSEKHGDYTFVTISDTGVNHRIHSVPNQDAAMFIVADEDFVLAVSDGVGSCAMAELGAQAAVASVQRVFCLTKRVQIIPQQADITEKIIAEWKSLLGNMNPDECCATLKVAMKLNNKLLLFSIGDGLLAVTSRGMHCCAPIDTNMFANQTMCLHTGTQAKDFWTSEFVLDTYVPYVIFACTDGVANGIQAGKELEMVSEIETVISEDDLQHELESLVTDISEFSSDDLTLGVVKYERKNAKPDR